LNGAEREARLQRAKVLGRVAYRHLQCCEIVGMITYEGEEKHLYQLDEDGLTAELTVPFRPHALRTEFSEIQIRADGPQGLRHPLGRREKLQGRLPTSPAIGSEPARLAGAYSVLIKPVDATSNLSRGT
jgi:hypothetical protein